MLLAERISIREFYSYCVISPPDNSKMKPTIVFVYNADSGLFNTVSDIAHKIFSSATYACQLCALTHSNFGMRKEWKEFLGNLDAELEFLHADELKERYPAQRAELPAILKRENERMEILIDKDEINRCHTLNDLQRLIASKLQN
jgi:hypothetical protein